ncbi:hypothetical protein COHA_004644 [Chlorella ohadii]|uniref:Uncharacterized protein n=1 Tax=Chlorella ohadii TaxID=2649997 RepID=A0AAD5DSV8_9CHLO|nr:hypothetical protein COHA_004644 [Chlorella ohadii]
MGIFDRLRGKREDAAAEVSSAEAAAQVSPSLDLTEAAPTALPSTSQQQQFGKQFGVAPSEQLYNPYEGLGAALDRRDLRGPAAFKVSKQPEFLFSEEALVHKRSWSENLTYYTGMGYLAGALLGGGKGAAQALTAPVALAGVESSQRLRINQLLNTSGKMGRGAGNALGVLGLLFASFESFAGYMTNGQVPDEVNTLAAGAATGMLYRSAAMSFEFDEDFDKKLLTGSGIALASYAVAGAAAPAKLHEAYMMRTELCHEPTMRWFGLAIGNAAAHQLVISASDPNTKVLKNGLKVAGASWLVYAAHNAYLANFEFDEDFDKRLLTGSGIALGAYAVAGAAAPTALHEFCMTRTELCHEPTIRWFGLAVGNAAAHQLVISASDPNTKVLKNGLKVAGASWLVYAAHNAYLAQEQVHKADTGYASAAAQAAFGALCLWRGFSNGN